MAARTGARTAIFIALALMIASPAPAQIRFFKDGSILVIGPTKEEKRRRQAGMMLGVMSGRRPVPQTKSDPALSQPRQEPSAPDGH